VLHEPRRGVWMNKKKKKKAELPKRYSKNKK
jgi:hypothetical protein